MAFSVPQWECRLPYVRCALETYEPGAVRQDDFLRVSSRGRGTHRKAHCAARIARRHFAAPARVLEAAQLQAIHDCSAPLPSGQHLKTGHGDRVRTLRDKPAIDLRTLCSRLQAGRLAIDRMCSLTPQSLSFERFLHSSERCFRQFRFAGIVRSVQGTQPEELFEQLVSLRRVRIIKANSRSRSTSGT